MKANSRKFWKEVFSKYSLKEVSQFLTDQPVIFNDWVDIANKHDYKICYKLDFCKKIQAYIGESCDGKFYYYFPEHSYPAKIFNSIDEAKEACDKELIKKGFKLINK